MKNILILIIFTFSLNAKADLASSLSLRSHIEQTHPSLVQASNSIKLRTTRGIDQKDSLFCWAFATANLLETSFLEKNPNINPKDIELSRWYIEKAVPSIYQLGTAIDALYTYSPQIGYVRNSEYKRGTHRTLNYTKFLNEKLSPKELRLKLIGDKEYWSYAISENQSGWGPHLDPDATEGKKSFYLSRDYLPMLIKKSLIKREALAFWYDEHIVTLYGADFDANGNAIKYYIKDSYYPYFYEATAEKTHKIIIEITGVSNLN